MKQSPPAQKSPINSSLAELREEKFRENLLESKTIPILIKKINDSSSGDVRHLKKIFTQYIYDQTAKKDETAYTILCELRALVRRLLIPSLTIIDPLKLKYTLPLDKLFRTLCEEFHVDQKKIDSNYREITYAPQYSRFLPILFSSKYNLEELQPLLQVSATPSRF